MTFYVIAQKYCKPCHDVVKFLNSLEGSEVYEIDIHEQPNFFMTLFRMANFNSTPQVFDSTGGHLGDKAKVMSDYGQKT